ncbi:MAG TPA: peptide ABC transporter substrate-binding protein [Phototrophicaceae bacterium]|jgi:peptide/nickel transport system substrate-binding protein|nr:peptide ABC transporter substrate-binding protein [Phototrophicaceae bacterium]
MLRGLRWQLLAFIAALSLFIAVLLSRPQSATIYVPENPPTTTVSTTTTSEVETVATLTPVSTQVQLESVNSLPSDVPTYREALIGQVQRLNPLFASLNPVDTDITSLIFEGLTRIDQYGEPAGGLASSWTISGDGLEYVFKLRQDVLWQDGISFTAADVDYTMSILRSPDFSGASEVGNFWRSIETAVLDDHTVRFRLTQPLGSFLEALRIGILPVHALQGITAEQLATHPFNLSPIGTGPYQIEAIRTADNQIRQIDLRVAPVYRQRPEGQDGYALDRVSFHLYGNFDQALQALQAGEVDGLAAQNHDQRTPMIRASQNTPSITIHNATDPTVGFLIFNWGNDNFRVFREQRVRVALQMGLDRSSIIERNLSDQAVKADSPMLINSWAYGSDLPWAIYDVNQAKALLADARIDLATPTEASPATEEVSSESEPTTEPTVQPTAESTSGALFSFAILTPDNPALVAVAQEIASQWSQLNIGVTVDAVDLDTYRSRLENHDFQAAMVELTKEGSADPDVYAFWHQGQYPNGKNYGGADDRTISELLEKARRDPYGINRIKDYQDFQREFITRAIAIPLYYPLYTYAINARIQGVQLGFIGAPSDRFLTIKDWTVTP